MVLESEFIVETIFGGFVSKVVNNVWDVSWEAIKKADNDRADKNHNFQTRIYQIIIDVLNLMTRNQYKGKDIIYDTAEKLLIEFKSGRNYNDAIKHGLKNILSNIDDSICQQFIRLLCHELGEEKNFDLYKEILLLLVNEKCNHTNEELQQMQSKLDYVIQRLDEKNIDTKDIKTEENHQIQSRTQEYADKWNANMFLNDFSEWDENAGVNVKLKDVYTEEHLPHFIWANNEKKSDNLDKLLLKYIDEKSENKMLLILGLPGIGKSTLITWITAHFIDRIDDILVYKFASDLNDIDWESDRITDEIIEKLGLSYADLNGKTLILDGYDEISINDKRKDILDSIYGDLIYSKKIKKISLIITCRVNYIEGFERLRCRYITLQPWDETQIKNFCNIYQKKTRYIISNSTIEKLIENIEILGIPLILYMVLALNINIDKEGSIVEIYDKIFALEGGIYDRCINDKSFAEKHRIGEIKKYIHQISREIAIWMFENNPNEASIPQLEYQKICVEVKKKSGKENEEIGKDFLIGNYFKLVKHCEGTETEELYFVHRTIYEYFVSEYIFSSVQKTINISNEKLASVLGSLLKGNKLSIKILEFLKIKISNSKLNNQFDKINNAFRLMIEDGMTYCTGKCYKNVMRCEMNVFTNMFEVLHLWDKDFFNIDEAFCDYIKYNYKNSLNLSKVDLSGINLIRADLRQADLRGADLREADLRQADLRQADLREADLGQADLRQADLRGADLREADLGQADLENVNLNNADLRGADLRGANLGQADLENVNLNNADLRGVIINDDQVQYLRTEYDLKDTQVLINKTHKVITYEESCKKFL